MRDKEDEEITTFSNTISFPTLSFTVKMKGSLFRPKMCPHKLDSEIIELECVTGNLREYTEEKRVSSASLHVSLFLSTVFFFPCFCSYLPFCLLHTFISHILTAPFSFSVFLLLAPLQQRAIYFYLIFSTLIVTSLIISSYLPHFTTMLFSCSFTSTFWEPCRPFSLLLSQQPCSSLLFSLCLSSIRCSPVIQFSLFLSLIHLTAALSLSFLYVMPVSSAHTNLSISLFPYPFLLPNESFFCLTSMISSH